LEFKHNIALCYGQQQSLTLQGHVPSPQVWNIARVVVDTLAHVVQQCVLNQNQGYWLLSNALTSIISLVCKIQLDCCTFEYRETQYFDCELETLQQCMQK
jgi:hypothetical protein